MHVWEKGKLDELRAALELATEEELQDLTAILFSRKFNPLDYLQTPEPVEVQSQNRQAWLDTIEERFCFLAADGITVLRGRSQQITYREALVGVCKYLKIPYSDDLTTVDLEAEVFLHLLGKVWKKLPAGEKIKLTQKVQQQLIKSELKKPLPLALQKDPLGLIFKGGSAIALTSVIQPMLLRQITRQFATHFATYQVARQAAIKGGTAAAAHLLKFDSVHGRWQPEVETAGEDRFLIDQQPLGFSSHSAPDQVPWEALGIDLVLECSCKFRTSERLEAYFKRGVKKVIVAAPVKQGALNVVMGITDHLYNPNEHHLLSAASCTTN